MYLCRGGPVARGNFFWPWHATRQVILEYVTSEVSWDTGGVASTHMTVTCRLACHWPLRSQASRPLLLSYQVSRWALGWHPTRKPVWEWCEMMLKMTQLKPAARRLTPMHSLSVRPDAKRSCILTKYIIHFMLYYYSDMACLSCKAGQISLNHWSKEER